MIRKIIFALSVVISLLATTPLQAQKLSAKAIEQRLFKSYNRIGYWQQQRADVSDDSLSTANDHFQKLLLAYGKIYPATMKLSFAKFQGLKASTSTDGQLRVYTWDTQTGGTMHFYANVLQYKTGGQLKTIFIPSGEGDNSFFCHELFTARLNGKMYYIISWVSVGSSKDVAEGVKVLSIDGALNTDARIIKTQTGLHSELSYAYDVSSTAGWKVRPSISYNNRTNTLRLPLVDAKESMTHKFISYKFTGKYFEKVKS